MAAEQLEEKCKKDEMTRVLLENLQTTHISDSIRQSKTTQSGLYEGALNGFMRSMFHLWHLALLFSLMALCLGLHSGALLELDRCVLENVVTDILTSKEILDKMSNIPTAKKAIGKKGKSPVKGISQIKVDDLKFTEISLDIVPGAGIKMSVTNKIALSGKSFLGGRVEMKMSVNIKTTTSLKKDNSSCPKLVKESCDTNLLDVKANLPKGILPNVMNNFLDKNLKTLLPTTVCPSVDIILSSVNEKLCLQDTRYPFGKSENLKYVMSNFPEVTADHFVYELNGTVQHGETIIESPEASELTEDNVFSTNPGDTSLILSADFLGRVFTALQKEGTFNVFVTESDLTDSGAMSPSMLTEIIPELPLDVQDYTINITVDEPTMVTLNPSKSLLHIYSTFEVSASFPESEPEALFVVQVHMNFRMQFSADDTNVHAVAALDRFHL
ncbi:BPI fold-containing family B member 6-like [Bombina bombina]|uniref:BPI fold-containing family B member 6-like n=1 Tax=Bombina bombina TaxID=8345 RepID=UPI00235A8A0A|nr:BPI fold-containing family B member 6-like [Bombina bombina]